MAIFNASQRDPAMAGDMLTAMLVKEQSSYLCDDYLNLTNNSPEVTAEDRQLLVDWCMRVVDVCGFCRETVTIAFGLFDRFLSRHTVWSASALQDKSVFQLVAITSLYIAIKTNERVAVHSELFASISEGGYSMDDIEETEKIILFVLSWRINGPTCLQIAAHVLSVLDDVALLDQDLMNWLVGEVRYQSELSLGTTSFQSKAQVPLL